MPLPTPPMYYKSASVVLRMRSDGVLTLKSLYSVKQRQGHAAELLRLICEYADEHRLDIELEAKQYGHTRGLDNQGLVIFYGKYGFVLNGGSTPDHLLMLRRSQDLHGV